MIKKTIDTFKLLDENYLIKTYIITCLFMIFFGYGIMKGHNFFILLLFLPWLLLGFLFGPFALIPFYKFMDGINNIFSNWIFFDRLLILFVILKLTLWISGIVFSLLLAPILGPIIAFLYYFKNIR